MMRARYGCLAAVLSLAGPLHGASPTYVATREVIIEFQVSQPADDAIAQLWVSRDSGRTWSKADAAQVAGHTLKYTAPADGRYDFYLVLCSSAGASAAPPQPGCVPAASVIVDTLPPLLQIHGARPESVGGCRRVVFDASLVEEHLSETAVRVFYRTDGSPWRDGGPAEAASGTVTWRVPAGFPERADLRVVVTDLAGNQAADEIRAVVIPPAHPQTSAQGQDRCAPTSRPTAEPGVTAVTIDPVRPVELEPLGPPGTGGAAASQPSLSNAQRADLRRLRELATGFISTGRYSLAVARLEDALRLAPDDVDTLAELGHVLVRLERYDEADARFAQAAQLRPDHLSALDGLALVDAARRRYADARVHLRALLQMHPESGVHWLRLGDMAHRVGNSGEALEAWEKVLSIPGADEELRAKARRRLEYFGRPARRP